MSRFRIRTARASDGGAIKACVDAAYTKYIERMGKTPGPMLADHDTAVAAGRVVVLVTTDERDEAIAGVMVSWPESQCWFVENVAVAPRFQGCGLGGQLMAHAQACALAAGLEGVELYTHAAMTENLAMYPRMGFVEFDRRREDGYDRVYFRKAVKAS